MTQKQRKSRSANKWKIFLPVILLFLFFKVITAVAQTLPSVDPESIKGSAAAGTPVEEIISAVDGGGLSTTQNLDALKPAPSEQAPDDAASQPEQPQPTPDPPAFDPDSLKNLETQGGLSTSPQIDAASPSVFKLASKFLERVVFHNDVEFMKRPTFDKGLDISGIPTFDKDTAGYAIIKKGNQSVAVDFDKEYDSPPVITATLSLEQYDDPDVRAAAQDLLLVSDVKYIVSKVSTKGFEIMMDQKADSDIPFSWHALAVDKPQTSKKKGDTLNNEPTTDTNSVKPGKDKNPAGTTATSSIISQPAVDSGNIAPPIPN